MKLLGGKGITEVSLGHKHSLACSSKAVQGCGGEVYSWGDNEFGQCGLGVGLDGEKLRGTLLPMRVRGLEAIGGEDKEVGENNEEFIFIGS